MMFQPFLRFNHSDEPGVDVPDIFSTFQPFLRFNIAEALRRRDGVTLFQPFLRFNGSCVWFLWVFKFFFGFL